MRTLTIVLALIVLVNGFRLAEAQDAYNFRADRKALPQNYRPHTARTYSGSALGHAQALQHYGKTLETISPETAKEHVVGVRQNLDAFTKEIDKLAKESANDPEAKKLIASIRDHQKKAAEHCGMAETECAKHEVKGSMLSNCCTDMVKELRAAHEGHEKLLKHLKIALPDELRKEAPAKSDK